MNTFAPFGFAESHRLGAAPSYQMSRRWISPGNASPIYAGDPIVQLATGFIAAATTPTAQVGGIFVGCEYMSISQRKWVGSMFWPGSDAVANVGVSAKVIDDPLMAFRVQLNGTIPGAGNSPPGLGTGSIIGLNACWAQPTGLNPDPHATGRSSMALDLTTNPPAATVTFPFRVVDLITDPPTANGSDQTSAYSWVYVTFNQQDYRAGVTGI